LRDQSLEGFGRSLNSACDTPTPDFLGLSLSLGSAQIDVKISFKGRQPNKESEAKPLCRYVSPATALHTKRNVILDA